MAATTNRVRELREARGLSQLELSARTRLSRQSLGAIEAGRATPAVDVALRLARALEAPVETLFGAPDEQTLEVAVPAAVAGRRVALAHVSDRWVGLPLAGDDVRQAADGLLGAVKGRRASVQPLRPLAELRENVVLTGCATGLAPLCDRLNAGRGPGRFRWLPCSSAAARAALEGGFAHVAGVHETDDNAAPRTRGRAVVTLARWEAGLLTRHDDATRVRDVGALARADVRLVLREPGAQARHLLERHARAAGVPMRRLQQAPLVAAGHLEVARAIAMNAADAGVATRDAALAYGLRFVPLAEERFDLVLASELLADPRIARLFDVLTSRAMRAELAALGYDVNETGRRVTGGRREA